MLHGDIATPADDRNVETGYVYNATAYILDKPQWQKLWAGTTSGSAGAEQALREYLYDDATVVGTPPLKGNLTGTRSYWQATPSYAYTTNSTSYDSYGRPLTVSDGHSNSTTTSYHPFYGYAASVTNALGHVTSRVVDPRWGVPTQTTDANGHTTTLQYDGYGRLTAVWLPTEPTSGPASYLFSYDAAARPPRVQSRRLQDAGSGTYRESWQYVDGFGRTLQTQQPAATGGSRVVTSQQYDGLGQLLHQSAAYELAGAAGSGYVAPDWTTVAGYHRFGYDELGNQWLDETRSQNNVLWSSTTIHDSWQRRQYDPNGRRTDYDADAFGNLGQVVEYNSASAGTTAVYTTTYSYNLAGALAQVTDAAGNVTSMGYDLLGRKTAMSDPDMGQWQYQYDAAGNLTAQRDGRGLWLHLGYDELNRLTSKRQDDPVSGSLIADYSYDAPGQLGLPSRSRAYSAEGVVEVQAVAFDSRGQMTQQQWVVPGSGGGTFRLDTAYNAAGRKAALTYPGGSGGQLGEVVSFGYDAIGQLTSVGGVVGGTTTLYLSAATYNAQGQPLELVNDSGANGLRRQYGYESNTQRLSVLRAGKTSPYTDLQELTYGYDNAGNVTHIVDGRNSSQRQCFQYDWLDRLTGAFTGDAACSAYSAAGVGAYSHSYGYDAIGNLTDYAGSSYTYGTTNEQPHAVVSAYGNSYGYDANGNQVRRTIAGVEYTLVYDYDNRLVEVNQGATLIASFLYAADGSRVMGTVDGVTTVYIAGLYEQSGAASTSYYEGGAMRRAGYAESNGVFYLLTDQLKSTSVIADQAGAEAARQFFYPYGGNRGGAGFSELTTKRFTGQYHEQGLPGAEGLSYYNARWYDPQLGRFTSPDTIVPKPDSPQAINRYSYGYNNPLKYDDPSGHCPRPPDDMGTTICLALFIQPATVNAGPLLLHGDGRDFQPDSDPTASRGYVWISLDTGTVQTHMNPSGYVTGYTYKPRYDKANDVWLNDVELSYTFHEPSPKNHWSVTKQKGGQITIQYDLVVSGPLDKKDIAPHINGTVSFLPRKDGRIGYSFARDGFPWAEAYLYRPGTTADRKTGGTWQTIFQDPAIRGNPYDLFGIEANLSLPKLITKSIQSLTAWTQPALSSHRYSMWK